MPNRIKLALAFYGQVEGEWVIEWMKFQKQLSDYKGYAGIVSMLGGCYVHMNRTQLTATALLDDSRPWDYLLMLDQDIIPPAGLMDRVGAYTDPIVGVLYFGRVMHNQRPVAGLFESGNFRRFNDDEAEALLDAPGLHLCGAVGTGCMAIRRDVLEQWDPGLYPWFQTPNTPETAWGEDVWFCSKAAEQGWETRIDSTLVAEHLGAWRSSAATFRARLAHDRRLAALQEPAVV